MPPDTDALASLVVLTIQKAMTPVLERLAAAEARLSVMGDLRDRVVTVETKAAIASPPLEKPADLGPLWSQLSVAEVRLSVLADLPKEIAGLRERLAVLETRPAIPGPVGEPGTPGKDGLDGKDGAAGLSFEGVYQEGQSYEKGHLVTWGGSSWHCNEPTTSKPGDGSKAWTLMVKRGRDGKDGVNGRDLAPVVKVGA